jgi:hypothetical protein
MRRLSRFVATGLVAMIALAPMVARADHDHFFQKPGFDSATDYGDPVTLSARLLEVDHDDNCPPNPCPSTGKQVDFYVDNEYVGTDITNSGGYAYLLITSAQKWHVGSYTIRAQYDRATPPATVTSTLTISKEATLMTARDGYLEARLLDNDNVVVTGQSVTFWLVSPAGEHELCTAFTDLDGVARCIPVTGAGMTPINAPKYRAVFNGTGDYVESSDDATLL